MKILDLENSYGIKRLIHPTKMGCTQDEKDDDYANVLDEITKSERIAVWNITNDSDGSFHTLGFFDLGDYDDNDDSDIKEVISNEALIETEDESMSIDPNNHFDESEYSIEFYDPANEDDLRRITEYLDCMFETESVDASFEAVADFDSVENFVEVVKEKSSSVVLALVNWDDSTCLLSVDSDKDISVKCFNNLPILFTDIFNTDVKFSPIGSIKTSDQVLNMNTEQVAGDYDNVKEMLINIFSEEAFDEYFHPDERCNDFGGDEGPSDSQENPAPETVEVKPVVKQVITTKAYSESKEKKVAAVATKPAAKIANTKTNLNLKETNSMKSMNILGKLNFKPINAAITVDGLLAIDVNNDPNDEVKYRAVDANNNFIDVEEATILIKEMPLLMPVMGNKPEIGDYVQQGSVWYRIFSDNEALNLNDGTTAGLKVKYTQFFKNCVFYRPMINPASMAQGNALTMLALLGSKEDAEGFDFSSLLLLNALNSGKQDMNSMLPFLLLSKDGDNGVDTNTLLLMSMMNGGKQDMNSMLPFLLLSKDGGNGIDTNTLLLMTMMNGGANPFGNIFGQAQAASDETPAAPAAPAKPNRRK